MFGRGNSGSGNGKGKGRTGRAAKPGEVANRRGIPVTNPDPTRKSAKGRKPEGR